MKKLLFIPFLFIAFLMSAAPIGEKQARKIAEQFFLKSATRAASVVLNLEWAGNSFDNVMTKSAHNDDEALVYIYNRAGEKGFVIVAGEDGMNPIIAFSYENSFDVEKMAPGAQAMLSGWCKQVQAERNSPATKAYTKSSPDVGIVLKKYETAQWNQGEPYNNLTPIINGQHTLTGCVATAMAIIARYYEYPANGKGTTPSYNFGDLVVGENNLASHIYDYDNMPLAYHQDSNYDDIQKAAVAQFMYDMGTSVWMNYGLEGSSSHSTSARNAFVNYFGYSKSAALIPGASSSSNQEWVKMLMNNISTYGPTYIDGYDVWYNSHAFVLDGYTSAGYFSANFGWGGMSNGYYLLPDLKYYQGQSAIFYLEPDENQTTSNRDLLRIYPETKGGLMSDATHFEKGGTYSFKVGNVYNSGSDYFRGDIILALCKADGSYSQTLKVLKTLTNNELNKGWYLDFSEDSFSITLPATIEDGDRIRIMYKGANSSDTWHWAEASAQGVQDEIILIPLPDEVAESLSLSIVKGSKISFQSIHAIQYSVKNSGGTVVASGSANRSANTDIDISDFAAGTYTFSFSSGGDPYNLSITF